MFCYIAVFFCYESVTFLLRTFTVVDYLQYIFQNKLNYRYLQFYFHNVELNSEKMCLIVITKKKKKVFFSHLIDLWTIFHWKIRGHRLHINSTLLQSICSLSHKGYLMFRFDILKSVFTVHDICRAFCIKDLFFSKC